MGNDVYFQLVYFYNYMQSNEDVSIALVYFYDDVDDAHFRAVDF